MSEEDYVSVESYDRLQSENATLLAMCADLRVQLAEVKEDSKRLEWLMAESSFAHDEGELIQLVVTEKVAACFTAKNMKAYKTAVRNEIDRRRIGALPEPPQVEGKDL